MMAHSGGQSEVINAGDFLVNVNPGFINWGDHLNGLLGDKLGVYQSTRGLFVQGQLECG